MPSKQTQNYQLSQWVKSDRVLMEDFNADNSKIDAALKALDTSLSGKASTSALNSLESTVNGKASQSALNSLTSTVNGLKTSKADASSLSSLQSTVSGLQSTLSALQTTVSGKQDASSALKLAVGSYTGNTSNATSTSASGSQTISLSFKPKAVLVIPEGGNLFNSNVGGYVYGGLAVTGSPGVYEGRTTLELTASGFKVYTYWSNTVNYFIRLNDKDEKYHYIALG